MDHYLNKSFEPAIKNFKSVIETHPEDLTAEFFLNTATRYLQKGIPENWAGVVEMMNK